MKFISPLAILAILFLMSTPAMAEVLTYERCEELFGESSPDPKPMTCQFCRNHVQISELNARVAAGERVDAETALRLRTLEAGQVRTLEMLEEGRETDRELQAQQAQILALLESSGGNVAPVQAAAVSAERTEVPVQPPQAPAFQQVALAGQPVTYGGVVHRTVAAPSLVSIHNAAVPDANRLHLTSMDSGAGRWAPGSQQVRVVIVRSGQPCQPDLVPGPGSQTWCSVVVPDGTNPMLSGFDVGYVDLDGDGATDATPVLMMNPKGGADLYLSARPGDNLQLVWLVQSGDYEEVLMGGVWHRVPVWHPYPKAGKGRSHWKGKGGRMVASAYGGSSSSH